MSEKRFDFQDLEEIDFAEELPAATHFGGSDRLFLGMLSREQLWQALEDSHIVAAVRERGYWPVTLETEFLTERDHRFFLLFRSEKILHMRLRLSFFRLHRHPMMPAMKLLFIDWMQSRHVLRGATHTRELFPGQDVPGLGIFSRIDLFLRRLVTATRAFGGFNIPEYFHDALLFHRAFRFYDPAREAFFRALLRDLRPHGAREISRALSEGRIRNRANEVQEWHGAEMLIFTHKPYAETIFDRRYDREVEKKMREFAFRLVKV